MHTLPHSDSDNGYSLRIGKNLPDHAANLAYVHTDSPEPEKNLSVINLANNIAENRKKEATIHKDLYTSSLKDTDFQFDNQIELKNLLSIKELSLFSYDNILEMTIPLVHDHIYYVRRNYDVHKGEWDNESGKVYIHSPRTQILDNYFTEDSRRYTYTGATNDNTQILLKGNFVPNRFSEQEAIFKDVMIVDLTEAYGHSAEPSLQEMDSLFESLGWFESISFTKDINPATQAPVLYTDILMNDGQPMIIPNQNVLLTNQFTYNKGEHALYYIHSLAEEINMGNKEVHVYINGKRLGAKTTFNRIQEDQLFVYENHQITVTKNDYEPLGYGEHYKVIGIPTGKDNIARLYLITNFLNDEETTYHVEYHDTASKNNHIRETLNTRPLFDEEMHPVGNNSFMRSYKLTPINENKNNNQKTYQQQGYYVQLMAQNQIEPMDINPFNRNPYHFNYQIRMDIETRFSERNPATINIGYIYINETTFNKIPLQSAMKKLVGQGKFPEYVTFRNPHHGAGHPYPESTDYWLASLEMPEEHYMDYDVLFISGYGDKDMTHYNHNLKRFLDSGGLLFIDNNDTKDSLQFLSTTKEQTFFKNIGFSREETNSLDTTYVTEIFNDRFYNHPPLDKVGLNMAQIQFQGIESPEDWTHLITSENSQPALTFLDHNGGKLFLSNMSLMLQIILGFEDAHKLLVNLLLYYLEHRTFKTPILKDYVVHHDDLFEEDYQTPYGDVLYFNDVSDQDSTQIVAKKVLGGRIGDVANKYLPLPYQRPISARYSTELQDRVYVDLENHNFEKYAATREFEDTQPNAIPGYRYIIQSRGERSRGGISRTTYHTGTQSLFIDFEESKGFFEKELLNVQAGHYQLSVYVKTNNTDGGGFSVYDGELNLLASNETLSGTNHWQQHTLYFEVEDESNLYIRLGSSEKAITGTIYFDELYLSNEGNIRMTPPSNGDSELYAYALEARGQNFLLGYHNNADYTVVKSDMVIEPTIRIRSFVYEWDSVNRQYQKHYGKNNYIKTQLTIADDEKVIGKLIDLIPSNEAGFQWNYAQNVYYQIEIDPTDPYYNLVNVSVFSPETNEYHYSNNGQWILSREAIWETNIETQMQLRAKSIVSNLKITGAKYTLVELNNTQVTLSPPNTNDESDRWYPRIKNGAFSRELLSEGDIKDLNKLGIENYTQDYFVGQHHYTIPEYHRQSFYPRKGERLVEEDFAVYVNPNTIQLSKRPLVVREQYMETPLYNFDGDRRTYRALDTFWDNRYPISLYLDEQPVYEGFDIDFTEGKVTFDRDVPSNSIVFAKYRQNNVRIFRRRLSNSQIEKERLQKVDDNTMRFEKENLATFPNPILYRDNTVINPSEYWIDFKLGLVHFYQNNRKNIYASYSYYIYEELYHTDINAVKGEITLQQEIHFLDEIVVDFIYREDYLEYKGYYDSEDNIYKHLDLNPTAGHTFTNKAYDADNNFSHYYEESSEKLLNRIVYFYLLPEVSQYYDTIHHEDNVVRHCFGEKEWNYIKAMYPAALLLGTIFVRENTTIDNIVMMDARRLGGGLKETVSDESISKRLGYTSGLWDVGGFDGLSYYKNAVTIIKLPNTLLKANGGQFSEDDIRKVIDKYLALGVYPIIEYYNPNDESEVDIAGDAYLGDSDSEDINVNLDITGEALLLRTVLDSSNTIIIEEE